MPLGITRFFFCVLNHHFLYYWNVYKKYNNDNYRLFIDFLTFFLANYSAYS